MFHCVYVSHIICLFIHHWALRLLSVLTSVNNAAVNMGMQVSFQVTDCVLFR